MDADHQRLNDAVEAPSRVWPVLALYASLLWFLGLAQLLASRIRGFDARQPRIWLGAMALAAGAEIALALLATGPHRRTQTLHLVPGPRPLRHTVIVGLLAFAVAEGMGLLTSWVGMDRLSAQVHSGLANLAGQGPALMPLVWLQLVLLSPFAEELFFRGYVQTRLVARWGGRVGVAGSAALFALTHLNLTQSLAAFVLGLVLGWGARRSRSLWPGIVAHAGINALSLVLMQRAADGGTGGLATGARTLAAVAIAAALGIWIERRTRRLDIP